jgi:hypothetical protein
MRETKQRTTPQKTARLLMGPEKVTRPKTLQATWWWWWWWWWIIEVAFYFLVLESCLFVCYPGVTTHCDCIFHSPVAGFSLLVFRGFLITQNDAPHSVGLLWTSDQSVAETSTWQHTTLTTEKIHDPVGFEPTISAGERPKTYALDRTAAGTGYTQKYLVEIGVVSVGMSHFGTPWCYHHSKHYFSVHYSPNLFWYSVFHFFLLFSRYMNFTKEEENFA